METREKKFKCPYGERPGKQFSDNCYTFGCIHQVNGDCPLKRDKDA